MNNVHITAEPSFGAWRVVKYGIHENGDPHVSSHPLRFSESEAAIKAAKAWANEEQVEFLEPLAFFTKRALYKFNQPLFLKKLQTAVRLPKWNCKTTVFTSGLTPAQAGRILANCRLTEEELADFSVEACQVNSEACADEHAKRYERGFEDLFGRKPEVADFRISAIGRDEFDDELKEKLRELKHCQFMWLDMALAAKGYCAIQKRRANRDITVCEA